MFNLAEKRQVKINFGCHLERAFKVTVFFKLLGNLASLCNHLLGIIQDGCALVLQVCDKVLYVFNEVICLSLRGTLKHSGHNPSFKRDSKLLDDFVYLLKKPLCLEQKVVKVRVRMIRRSLDGMEPFKLFKIFLFGKEKEGDEKLSRPGPR